MESLIRVRACANLAGRMGECLHFGQIAYVDPADPYIAELLAAALLVHHPASGLDEPHDQE